MEFLQPANWPRPKGYSNGIIAEGRMLFLGGQVGWDETETFQTDDFAGQVRQALLNIVTLLNEAQAGPENIVRMTWYITDKREYLGSLKEVGQAYREIIGKHYPVMAMVQVSALMEDKAKVEIEVTAVLP